MDVAKNSIEPWRASDLGLGWIGWPTKQLRVSPNKTRLVKRVKPFNSDTIYKWLVTTYLTHLINMSQTGRPI
jgi:hypothetical protein